ncbi:putative fungal-specific transcription factor [Boeremia exigua]|uniref:putative fungal-specific transcription factor n=1 Tax=Boeremia exigua TaxID=749465 RepID=UPI001E8CD5CC|nr:putative fungal-specific transcription factor [Boeremia exigua]KAH6637641.1 putative fungal-specific transcription factor [Boeremia exigua]
MPQIPSEANTFRRHASLAVNVEPSVADDGRKPASRSYVQLLRDRIALLECILQKYSIDIDTAIAQYQSEHQNSPVADADDTNTTCAQIEEVCAAFEGTLSLDESINFDEDGECHYFGPTSGRLGFEDCTSLSEQNAYIVLTFTVQQSTRDKQMNRQNGLRNTCSSVNNLRYLSAQLSPSTLQIGADLQEELIDSYFVWHNPCSPVLNELLFKRDLQQGKGRYFSPLLLKCVLSAGCRFSDRPEVRTNPNDPNTAGDQFLEEAEALFQYELKVPSLTTIQAAAIMIYLHASRAADTMAWLYQGTAHRLALDLGLNFDATSVRSSGYVSPEEVDVRRQIYWSLYCTDKLHATYSGRVCTMLDVQGAVKLSCSTSADSSSSGLNFRAQRTTLLLRAHATQCQILEKLLLGFYAPQPSHAGSRREPFFNATLVELKNWLYDLPDDLRLDVRGQPNTFPQTYTLHMTLHTALILLGNGVLALTASLASSSTDALAKKASCVCYEAAVNICIAAKKYRNAFGSFHKTPISATHCLLSAALVLIQVASNEQEASMTKAATANLDLCLQCLDEMSGSYKIAERIHRNLVLLKAQKLGVRLDGNSVHCTLSAAMLAPETDQANSGLFDLPDLTGYDPQNAVLLNDAHSFLESYSSNDCHFETFDFTTQLADIGMQDSFLWGNFGMEFPHGSEF